MTITALGVCLVVGLLWIWKRWEQRQWEKRYDWYDEGNRR